MAIEAPEPAEQPEPGAPCRCTEAPHDRLQPHRELGMDQRYGQVSLLTCPECGQLWLRYHYEQEAFTASGRWYLGAIPAQQASGMTAEQAKAILEGLSWYFYGGSFYAGRIGKACGPIW